MWSSAIRRGSRRISWRGFSLNGCRRDSVSNSSLAGADLAHVPYRGDYTTDLIGGRVQVAFFSIAAEPAVASRLGAMGIDPTPMTAADFGKFIAAETGKWAKVVQFAHIQPE